MNYLRRISKLSIQNVYSRFYSKTSSNEIPKNIIADLQSSQHQEENGTIYDKKPFKIALKEGKLYSWCLCGKSKQQPLCDGTHKNVHLKIKLRPVRFSVRKDGDFWLCNCKQTKNRPFCDGTHKCEAVQSGVK